jgi:hypothetical protein
MQELLMLNSLPDSLIDIVVSIDPRGTKERKILRRHTICFVKHMKVYPTEAACKEDWERKYKDFYLKNINQGARRDKRHIEEE